MIVTCELSREPNFGYYIFNSCNNNNFVSTLRIAGIGQKFALGVAINLSTMIESLFSAFVTYLTPNWLERLKFEWRLVVFPGDDQSICHGCRFYSRASTPIASISLLAVRGTHPLTIQKKNLLHDSCLFCRLPSVYFCKKPFRMLINLIIITRLITWV